MISPDCGERENGKRSKKVRIDCACGCGTVVERYRGKVQVLNFAGKDHAGRYYREKHLERMCGPYLSIAREYLDGSAGHRYRDLSGVRHRLCPFFLYACEHGSLSLDSVNSTTVTAFQIWARSHNYTSAANDVSALSTFFHWLIVEERHPGPNPVIPQAHGKKKKPRVGKPYTAEETATIRRLLNERGNERLRAFFELASASGMRRAELVRLTLGDLDLLTNNAQVGIPNKTLRERNALFSNAAATALSRWLEVRRTDCGHSYLFHNYLGGPLRGQSILDEFKRTLCKWYDGKLVNEVGLETFSIHRLRHTLASDLANVCAEGTVIMGVLGWVSPASMEHYIKLDEDSKRSSYHDAMSTAEGHPANPQSRVTISPSDLLKQLAAA